jgi:hypothetical protein
MLEDPAHDLAARDERDELALAAAVRADEDVDLEDALQELGPGGLGLGVGRAQRLFRERLGCITSGRVRLGRHDPVAPLGRGREVRRWVRGRGTSPRESRDEVSQSTSRAHSL